MSKKSHIGYTRLSKKHIDNYLKGKSFIIKPTDHDDESNTIVKLHYKAKKKLSKLERNLMNKKGTRVLPDDLNELEAHTGNGFFDSIKNVVSSPIVKDIVKATTPAIANIVGNQVAAMTGSQTAGDVSKSLVNSGSKAYTGNGFNLHSIGLGIANIKGKKYVGGSFASPMGGSLSSNQFVGIGPNVPSFSNPDDKLAYARSCRKKPNGIIM